MSTPARDPFLTTTVSDESPVVNSDYATLKRAWVNEMRSPELLPYESRVVDNIMKSIRSQWTFINARQAQWAGRDSFIRDLYIMEADRVSYILKSYLRARLFKIQKYARHYLVTSSSLLSDAETHFAKNVLQITEDAFQSLFLRHLPQGDQYFQSLVASDDPGGDMIRRPKLDRAVFIKVNEPVGGVGPDNISLEKDKTYIVRYDLVRNLLAEGRINLI
jgi:GINS complex subunit 4